MESKAKEYVSSNSKHSVALKCCMYLKVNCLLKCEECVLVLGVPDEQTVHCSFYLLRVL